MPLLNTADCDPIRAALDAGLTADSLPDATILLDIYRGVAEDEVLGLYADAQADLDAGGANAPRIKRAAIFFCAAMLAPIVPRVSQMNLGNGGFSYGREVFDPVERAANLRRLAIEQIDEILEPGETTTRRPTHFAAARGYRGR